jgi:S-adenosylmethionine:diacylglycerol 3-amino-3-carboxypropyl transferase
LTKLKAVRLLGRNPISALDCLDVARVYLGSHVLLNQEGDPFQEIMNELSAEEASVYVTLLQQRRYDALTAKDATAARQLLRDLVDRVTEQSPADSQIVRSMASAMRRHWFMSCLKPSGVIV